MHNLPPQRILERLANYQLTQVRVGQNDLIFRFEPDVTLQVEGAIAFGPPESETVYYADSSQGGAASALVGLRIQRAYASDYYLKLIFEDGRFVQFFDDSYEYESFVLTVGSEVFAV